MRVVVFVVGDVVVVVVVDVVVDVCSWWCGAVVVFVCVVSPSSPVWW